jgi:hypothetical protein
MPELIRAIPDILFYAICFGIAIFLLNDGGGGGKRSWLPI